jgi:hypothetical protein
LLLIQRFSNYLPFCLFQNNLKQDRQELSAQAELKMYDNPVKTLKKSPVKCHYIETKVTHFNIEFLAKSSSVPGSTFTMLQGSQWGGDLFNCPLHL